MAQTNPTFQEEGEISSILSAGVDFDGDMTFTKPVLIQGKVRGIIKTESDVFVSSEARVDADIAARRLSVKGSIEGTIEASERLELFRSARIRGIVKTADMVMQSGALVNGTITMTTEAVEGALETAEVVE